MEHFVFWSFEFVSDFVLRIFLRLGSVLQHAVLLILNPLSRMEWQLKSERRSLPGFTIHPYPSPMQLDELLG